MRTLKTTALSILTVLLFTMNINAQNKAISGPVNIVITNYLALKDALISGNGTVAEGKAKILLASIGTVPKADLTTDEAVLLPKLEFDSRHISEVNKIDHQREHFANLSNNLYTLLKS